MHGTVRGARCAALVGPFSSGKTTLMEALLFAAGAIHRKGKVTEGNTVGDDNAEARARQMSTEVSAATCKYLDDKWTLLDCPGSVEFAQDAHDALMVADVAIVVCEPDVNKALALGPIFQFLETHDIPHILFINKMDGASVRLNEVVATLKEMSSRPLVARQIPIPNGEAPAGYVDLISERAFTYKPGEASVMAEIPDTVKAEEQEARQELLESLADFDDQLLEQLLEDVVPEPKAIYGTYAQSFGQDRVVPVLLGSGEAQNGIVRLWKTLRHDTPGPDVTARRRKIDTKEAPVVEAFKSLHAAHAGKLTLARIWAGGLAEGESLGGFRVGGLAHVVGSKQEKTDKAGPGEVIALGRLDEVQTGETLMKSKHEKMAADWPVLDPVYALALITEKREDEVRLTEALHKLIEEDASYQVEQNAETHELVLWGQGEMHLRVAIERLQNRYNISVKTKPPRVAYRETIRKPVKQHGRHKKQSGGHGQFGDVHLEIVPKPRGSGFEFVDKVVGGAVPRQFIGSVEAGVREYLQKGPLGFPVVDLSVCLFDGQHHAVDSSDQAFRAAAQLAMREGMPQGNPILLEPIYKVVIHVPAEYTSKATKLVTGRRGQILGFEANETRKGWDDLQAYLPQAEMHDLIIDLRSLSQGVGNYSFVFDHLAELTGKEAGRVIGQHAASDAG